MGAKGSTPADANAGGGTTTTITTAPVPAASVTDDAGAPAAVGAAAAADRKKGDDSDMEFAKADAYAHPSVPTSLVPVLVVCAEHSERVRSKLRDRLHTHVQQRGRTLISSPPLYIWKGGVGHVASAAEAAAFVAPTHLSFEDILYAHVELLYEYGSPYLWQQAMSGARALARPDAVSGAAAEPGAAAAAEAAPAAGSVSASIAAAEARTHHIRVLHALFAIGAHVHALAFVDVLGGLMGGAFDITPRCDDLKAAGIDARKAERERQHRTLTRVGFMRWLSGCRFGYGVGWTDESVCPPLNGHIVPPVRVTSSTPPAALSSKAIAAAAGTPEYVCPRCGAAHGGHWTSPCVQLGTHILQRVFGPVAAAGLIDLSAPLPVAGPPPPLVLDGIDFKLEPKAEPHASAYYEPDVRVAVRWFGDTRNVLLNWVAPHERACTAEGVHMQVCPTPLRMALQNHVASAHSLLDTAPLTLPSPAHTLDHVRIPPPATVMLGPSGQAAAVQVDGYAFEYALRTTACVPLLDGASGCRDSRATLLVRMIERIGDINAPLIGSHHIISELYQSQGSNAYNAQHYNCVTTEHGGWTRCWPVVANVMGTRGGALKLGLTIGTRTTRDEFMAQARAAVPDMWSRLRGEYADACAVASADPWLYGAPELSARGKGADASMRARIRLGMNAQADLPDIGPQHPAAAWLFSADTVMVPPLFRAVDSGNLYAVRAILWTHFPDVDLQWAYPVPPLGPDARGPDIGPLTALALAERMLCAQPIPIPTDASELKLAGGNAAASSAAVRGQLIRAAVKAHKREQRKSVMGQIRDALRTADCAQRQYQFAVCSLLRAGKAALLPIKLHAAAAADDDGDAADAGGPKPADRPPRARPPPKEDVATAAAAKAASAAATAAEPPLSDAARFPLPLAELVLAYLWRVPPPPHWAFIVAQQPHVPFSSPTAYR